MSRPMWTPCLASFRTQLPRTVHEMRHVCLIQRQQTRVDSQRSEDMQLGLVLLMRGTSLTCPCQANVSQITLS
eukprot:3624289-Amphidinium_carterae.1